MQVYAELALLENFCMNFTMLYGAKAVTKNPVSYLRIALSALTGAAFAVIFPLLGIENVLLQTAVKLAAGMEISAIGGKFSRFAGYLKFTLVFFALTFLTGGALFALFALAGGKFLSGQGYMLASMPAGIPLFGALVTVLCIKRAVRAFMKRHTRCSVRCRITVGGRVAEVGGFFDSGNKVHFRGMPVSVAPRAVAEKLTDVGGIDSCVEIHTVSGRTMLKVFMADSVEIDDGTHRRKLGRVMIGVSQSNIKKLILSPDLAEI